MEKLTLDKFERDFYDCIYKQTRSKFDMYVDKGVLLHNYAHIFELLSRLRQVTGALPSRQPCRPSPIALPSFACLLCLPSVPSAAASLARALALLHGPAILSLAPHLHPPPATRLRPRPTLRAVLAATPQTNAPHPPTRPHRRPTIRT